MSDENENMVCKQFTQHTGCVPLVLYCRTRCACICVLHHCTTTLLLDYTTPPLSCAKLYTLLLYLCYTALLLSSTYHARKQGHQDDYDYELHAAGNTGAVEGIVGEVSVRSR